jgi:hypothetical protein
VESGVIESGHEEDRQHRREQKHKKDAIPALGPRLNSAARGEDLGVEPPND